MVSTSSALQAANADVISKTGAWGFWLTAAVAGLLPFFGTEGGRALDFAVAFAGASVRCGNFLGHSASGTLHVPSAKFQQYGVSQRVFAFALADAGDFDLFLAFGGGAAAAASLFLDADAALAFAAAFPGIRQYGRRRAGNLSCFFLKTSMH